eukprot:gene1780-2202_t
MNANKSISDGSEKGRVRRRDVRNAESEIGLKLRALYASVQEEEIPARFLDLLEKLDEAERNHAQSNLIASLPKLRAFAVSLIGNPDRADDLVQDTIMKAWAKQDSFEAGTNIKAWLFTILRNEFYSQMRKRGREVQDSDGVFTEQLSVHPSQYGALDLQDFRKALEKLPDDQREAIILVGAGGGYLWMRRWDNQEPRQPCKNTLAGTSRCPGRG